MLPEDPAYTEEEAVIISALWGGLPRKRKFWAFPLLAWRLNTVDLKTEPANLFSFLLPHLYNSS